MIIVLLEMLIFLTKLKSVAQSILICYLFNLFLIFLSAIIIINSYLMDYEWELNWSFSQKAEIILLIFQVNFNINI